MSDMEEMDLRVALRSAAEQIDIPAGLASRTREAALEPSSWWQRNRARRGAPRTASILVRGLPKLAYAGLAVVLLVGFYAVGIMTQPEGRSDRAGAPPTPE